MSRTQTIVTLDLEGVLIPEVWIAVAERTGIDGLRRTTRDEPDYDVLMRYRLGLLAEHGLTMSLITDVIAGLEPLPGAQARSSTSCGLAHTGDHPLRHVRAVRAAVHASARVADDLLPHVCVVDGASDRIVDYRLRQPDQKRKSVEAFRSLEYRIIAAGDSYNDTTMLGAADVGFLFRAPENVIAEFPQFRAFTEYADLLDAVTDEL